MGLPTWPLYSERSSAQAALAEPKVRARYEKIAKKQHKRAWDVAVSDYFKVKDLLSKT